MKKEPPTELETITIGPSCCGHFAASRDLCNHCIANGMYSHALCFVPPAIGNGTGYEQQQKELHELADIIGGGKTGART